MPKFVAALYIKQDMFVEIEAPDRESAWDIYGVDVQSTVQSMGFNIHDVEMYTAEEFEEEFDPAAEVLSGYQEVAEITYFPQGDRVIGQFDMLDGMRYVIEADTSYRVDELFRNHRKECRWDGCSQD